jgi:hypothetical protein
LDNFRGNGSLINKNMSKIVLIFAPEDMLFGGKYFFMSVDSKLIGAELIEKQGTPLKGYELEVGRLEQILKVRRDELLGTETFWGIVQDLIINKSQYATFNNHVGAFTKVTNNRQDTFISGFPVYLEIPIGQLNVATPIGLHDSTDEFGAQLTWAEWNAGGDQPTATRLDGLGCIVRTNINYVNPTMAEIVILAQYANGNVNRTLLNEDEVRKLMSSAAYTLPE